MKKFLIIIFLVSSLLRFWKLTEHPFHLTMDEVAISVAARSISENLRDEYGNLLPLAFFSVGDFKPPALIYISALVIKFFGFSEFTSRLPVAFFGSLTPLALALLVKKLNFSSRASFLGGMWMAVLPWHIHYSRSGFGAVLALFFAVVGIWQFLSWLESQRQMSALVSAISFSLSVWSYHSSRVFVPILVLFLIIIYKNDIFVSKRKIHQFFNFLLISLIFALPLLYLTFFTDAISQRASSTSILREPSLNQNLHRGEYENTTEFVFDNDLYLIANHWMDKYLGYFDLRFWFAKGPVFTPIGYPGIGLLQVADIPIFVFGLIFLIKSRDKKLKFLLVTLFLSGPLAASFAMNEQHPLRSLVWVIFFCLVITQGFEIILKTLKYRYIYLYLIFTLFSLLYFKQIYTRSFPYFYAEAWQLGYEEASLFACENKNNYDKIFLSESFGANEKFTSLPHYYLSFYCGGKPSDYVTSNPLGEEEGVYVKRPLWGSDEANYKNTLFIAAPFDFPESLDREKIVKKIIYPDGKDAFWFVETD